jgi:hypothetical protein
LGGELSKHFWHVGAAVLISVLYAGTAQATPIVIDFENLAEFDSLTTQLPGLTFTDATVLTAGSSLNEMEFPPHSGSNAVFDDGGPMSITFETPVSAFGGYFTYSLPLTISAFDVSNNPIGFVLSTYFANLAESGDSGSAPNEFLQFVSAAGIASVTIAGDPFGGSFVMDDATVTPFEAPAPVPEPGTWLLVLSGSAGMAWRWRGRLRRCG